MTRIRQEISLGYHLFLDSVPIRNRRLKAYNSLQHTQLGIELIAGFGLRPRFRYGENLAFPSERR